MKAHKKFIIIAVLCVACVGILAACFFLSRNRTPEFSPDPPQSETPSTWEESRSDAGGSGGAPTSSAASGTSSEEYPKTTQDADGNVGIEFTPPSEKLKPDAPEPPKTDADNTNPSAPPKYSSEQVKPSTEKKQGNTSSKPAAGSSNGKGAVYDPVFGWIVPGDVSQAPTDNKGDPNKQVGEMGP